MPEPSGPHQVPFWLRFWTPPVLCFGLGLVFGSTFSAMWWPGATITLCGFALMVAYFYVDSKTRRRP